MSERSIEIVREYNFDPKEVIAGLNGYYESDKRNDYIDVRKGGNNRWKSRLQQSGP